MSSEEEKPAQMIHKRLLSTSHDTSRSKAHFSARSVSARSPAHPQASYRLHAHAPVTCSRALWWTAVPVKGSKDRIRTICLVLEPCDGCSHPYHRCPEQSLFEGKSSCPPEPPSEGAHAHRSHPCNAAPCVECAQSQRQ